MAGGLFFISVFLISVIGVLLLRPISVPSYTTDYNQVNSELERKNVTVKMAKFLENNPQIVNQERLDHLEINGEAKSIEYKSVKVPVMPADGMPVTIRFLSSDLQFPSRAAFDQWVVEQSKGDTVQFIKSLESIDDPDLYLDTVRKVAESKKDPETLKVAKDAFLQKAKALKPNQDYFHQAMTQKALQNYLDIESDLKKGKETVEELLKQQDEKNQ